MDESNEIWSSMTWKQLILYGFLLAVVLFVLEVTHYRAMVRDIPLELFGLSIAVLFLLFGIWLGQLKNQPKQLSGKFKTQQLGLSARELEVLTHMAAGLSNQEIADKLFVSLNTIKTHVSNILVKVNAKRRTQAIQRAIELELIPPTNE